MKISTESLKDNIAHYLGLLIPPLARVYFFHQYQIRFNKQVDTKPDLEVGMFLLPALMENDAIVFDIGANRGIYSYFMQKITSPEKIYAFEPNPREFRLLRKLFPDINTFNIALSSELGKKTLRVPILNNGLILTTRSSIAEINEDIEVKKYVNFSTSTNTVDNIVEKLGLTRLDFMKVDVEGHEFEVVKGAQNTLSKMEPTLLIEIEQRHHSFPIDDIFNYIFLFNYSGFFIDLTQKKCLPLNDFSIERHQKFSNQGLYDYVNNFIFINNNRLEKKLNDIKTTLGSL